MNSCFKSVRDRHANDDSVGFTLIELLIVIVVLGILAAVVVFALGSVTGNAQATACTADAKTVLTAVGSYNAKNTTGISTENTGVATYNVTMNFSSFWAIGASVTGVGVVGAVVNGNGGVASSTFMTLNGSAITPGMTLTIGGSGTGVVTSVVVGTTGGITLGVPDSYGASGTQAAALIQGGYLNAWPSAPTYAISLSTTKAGHVMIYVPATSTTGVDYASQTASTGCNVL